MQCAKASRAKFGNPGYHAPNVRAWQGIWLYRLGLNVQAMYLCKFLPKVGLQRSAPRLTGKSLYNLDAMHRRTCLTVVHPAELDTVDKERKKIDACRSAGCMKEKASRVESMVWIEFRALCTPILLILCPNLACSGRCFSGMKSETPDIMHSRVCLTVASQVEFKWSNAVCATFCPYLACWIFWKTSDTRDVLHKF